MRPSLRRNHWFCATIAPWALAGGLLMSFTASAGYGPLPRFGGSAHKPLSALRLAAESAAPLFDGRARLASLAPDNDLAFEALAELQGRRGDGPRFDMKADVGVFPELDRTLKGDLTPPLRPGLSRLTPADDKARRDALIRLDDEALLASLFLPSAAGLASANMLDRADRWLRLRDLPRDLAREPAADIPPEAADATPAQDVADGRSGATPTAPRDLVLASTTPSAADATPRAIAAAPVSAPTNSAATPRAAHYAGLVAPVAMAREMKCLAEAVYFEARSESGAGQAAVAQVVLNRVKSGLYPETVCGVVYQNSDRYLGCQFTFACEGKSLRVTEAEPWRVATQVAQAVYEGREYNADVGAATHYHARHVRPWWARRLLRTDVVGQHVFYRLRPGQT